MHVINVTNYAHFLGKHEWLSSDIWRAWREAEIVMNSRYVHFRPCKRILQNCIPGPRNSHSFNFDHCSNWPEVKIEPLNKYSISYFDISPAWKFEGEIYFIEINGKFGFYDPIIYLPRNH
jgi:hypothetical protein